MNRIVSGMVAVTLGVGGALVAVPADAALIPNRVTMTGGYGHVKVTGFRKVHGHQRWESHTLWSGWRTPRGFDSVTVYAFGEGRCAGDLIWIRRGPDKNMGGAAHVKNNRVTVRVKRDC